MKYIFGLKVWWHLINQLKFKFFSLLSWLTLSVIIVAFQVMETCNLCWVRRSQTRLASAVSPFIRVRDAGEKNPRKRWVLLWIAKEEKNKPAANLEAAKTDRSFCCCYRGKFPSRTQTWQNFLWTQRKFRVIVLKCMSQWPPVSTEVLGSLPHPVTSRDRCCGCEQAVCSMKPPPTTPPSAPTCHLLLDAHVPEGSHENRNPLVVSEPPLSSSPPLRCACWCMALITAQSASAQRAGTKSQTPEPERTAASDARPVLWTMHN